MFNLTLKEAPKEEPLTLGEIKTHLRIDADLTEDDADLTVAIAVAREHIERTRGLALVTQKWTAWGNSFYEHCIELRKRPIVSIDSVKYLDSNGVLQTLSPTLYQVDTKSFVPRVMPAYGQCWPTGRLDLNAVQIDCTFGYGPAAKVPDSIKWAIRLLVGHWYENREESINETFRLGNIPMGVNALLGSDAIVNV